MSDKSNEFAPILCRHGVFNHYASDNAVGSHLRRFGEWAEEEILLMSLIVQKSWVALDVGANIGTHAVPMSRMVGQTGRVYAFEPQSIIMPILLMNLVNNDAAHNVSPIKALVSDNPRPRLTKTKGFTPTKGNMGSHTFVREASDAEPFDGEYILETSIDRLGLERCDFIKMDIQGFEKFALAGADSTLSKLRPIVYYEQMGLTNHETIKAQFMGHGYVLLVHYARPYNLNNFNRFLGGGMGKNIEVNIVAVPSERLHQVERDRLRSKGIELYDIENFTGSHTVTPVTSPWSMPDEAYAGTALAPYLSQLSTTGLALWTADELQLPISKAWSGKKFDVDDVSHFQCFESELDMGQSGDARLNLQLIVQTASGERVWTTLFYGDAAQTMNAKTALRVTQNCFDNRTFSSLSGKGHIEIRGRAENAEGSVVLSLRQTRISVAASAA